MNPGFDPKWSFYLGIAIIIQTAVGQGAVPLTNTFPVEWIPYIKGWSQLLAFVGQTIQTALAGYSSRSQGPLTPSLPSAAGKLVALFAVLVLGVLMLGGTARAADVLPSKAPPALSYNYPTTKCGIYYGVNTMGSTGSVSNAAVGTQVVQGDIGLTLGYTCPMGAGYWFVDASADLANFNGSQNGFSVTGPAMFMERFGFGAPIDMVMSMIPGLSSLQNAVPSLIPLPSDVKVVTSNPYLFAAVHEEDVGLNFGFAANKQWLVSAGFGLGNKTRLSNGVVFDPFVEYILPSSRMCFGPIGGSLCSSKGAQVNVGMILEF